MIHRIDIVECNTNNITFIADGEQITVSGEFTLNHGVFNHTHWFSDNECCKISWLNENELDVTEDFGNIVVTGYTHNHWIDDMCRSAHNIINISDFPELYGNVEECVEDLIDEICEVFPKVDTYTLRHDLSSILTPIFEN